MEFTLPNKGPGEILDPHVTSSSPAPSTPDLPQPPLASSATCIMDHYSCTPGFDKQTSSPFPGPLWRWMGRSVRDTRPLMRLRAVYWNDSTLLPSPIHPGVVMHGTGHLKLFLFQ
ncbi:unnamed protein product [Pleuronectes platessa]|uniref:Uncharacterized protein n=1 Tax=Pleuronectes platessa TaxID=8262 RepID=A0A9N7ZD99_PLEPL|nr:unnamed protein product [Pleuronectes platessa]